MDHLWASQMIIYGKPSDHLWTNPEEFWPFAFQCLVIIYGHLWSSMAPARVAAICGGPLPFSLKKTPKKQPCLTVPPNPANLTLR